MRSKKKKNNEITSEGFMSTSKKKSAWLPRTCCQGRACYIGPLHRFFQNVAYCWPSSCSASWLQCLLSVSHLADLHWGNASCSIYPTGHSCLSLRTLCLLPVPVWPFSPPPQPSEFFYCPSPVSSRLVSCPCRQRPGAIPSSSTSLHCNKPLLDCKLFQVGLWPTYHQPPSA